jgi:hypothetical protein
MHILKNRYPFPYLGAMKKDYVSKAKLLSRKQRMFMIQCKEHVCLHKKYFSKQSKRLRMFREIAHGQTWFYGNVNQLASSMEGEIVSEDDEFWDKRFFVMQDIYYIRKKILMESGEVLPDDYELGVCVDNLIHNIVVLPTGDVVRISNRQNPSGADATTENNCIARLMYEIYMQILYSHFLFKAPDLRAIVCYKKGTRYLGDDRIAASADYPPGYFNFYETTICEVGVILKSHVRTPTPEGSEFAGFKLERSHWDKNYYVPHYSLEKIWAGLFSKPALHREIVMTRFMAFAFLIYPHYDTYVGLRKHVISYLQKLGGEDTFTPIKFWADESYLRRMWTGYESDGGKSFDKCLRKELKFVLVGEHNKSLTD